MEVTPPRRLGGSVRPRISLIGGNELVKHKSAACMLPSPKRAPLSSPTKAATGGTSPNRSRNVDRASVSPASALSVPQSSPTQATPGAGAFTVGQSSQPNARAPRRDFHAALSSASVAESSVLTAVSGVTSAPSTSADVSAATGEIEELIVEAPLSGRAEGVKSDGEAAARGGAELDAAIGLADTRSNIHDIDGQDIEVTASRSSGYLDGELPDTDSEDSVILSSVREGRANAPEAPLLQQQQQSGYRSRSHGQGCISASRAHLASNSSSRRGRSDRRGLALVPPASALSHHRAGGTDSDRVVTLVLDNGAQDDEDIESQETALKLELLRSSMHIHGLRSTLEAAQSLAAEVGVALRRGSVRMTARAAAQYRAATSAANSSRSAHSTSDDHSVEGGIDGVQRGELGGDERPIRPSSVVDHFGDITAAAASSDVSASDYAVAQHHGLPPAAPGTISSSTGSSSPDATDTYLAVTVAVDAARASRSSHDSDDAAATVHASGQERGLLEYSKGASRKMVLAPSAARAAAAGGYIAGSTRLLLSVGSMSSMNNVKQQQQQHSPMNTDSSISIAPLPPVRVERFTTSPAAASVSDTALSPNTESESVVSAAVACPRIIGINCNTSGGEAVQSSPTSPIAVDCSTAHESSSSCEQHPHTAAAACAHCSSSAGRPFDSAVETAPRHGLELAAASSAVADDAMELSVSLPCDDDIDYDIDLCDDDGNEEGALNFSHHHLVGSESAAVGRLRDAGSVHLHEGGSSSSGGSQTAAAAAADDHLTTAISELSVDDEDDSEFGSIDEYEDDDDTGMLTESGDMSTFAGSSSGGFVSVPSAGPGNEQQQQQQQQPRSTALPMLPIGKKTVEPPQRGSARSANADDSDRSTGAALNPAAAGVGGAPTSGIRYHLGSLASRVEALRSRCINELGRELFVVTFEAVKRAVIFDLEGEEVPNDSPVLDLAEIRASLGSKQGAVDAMVAMVEMEQSLL